MFEKDSRSDAPIPEMPTTEGIEVSKRACSRVMTISADTGGYGYEDHFREISGYGFKIFDRDMPGNKLFLEK